MDSLVYTDEPLVETADNEWRAEQLPHDHIYVPTEKLPDPEADNGDSHLTMAEQERKWTDLSLSLLAPEINISDQVFNLNNL